ncbi:MAG: hypothetical protein NVS4B11_33360 [Ktedonobacteraceae bacterium]
MYEFAIGSGQARIRNPSRLFGLPIILTPFPIFSTDALVFPAPPLDVCPYSEVTLLHYDADHEIVSLVIQLF